MHIYLKPFNPCVNLKSLSILGLFIGTSILSYCEMIDVIVTLIVFYCKRRKAEKSANPNPSLKKIVIINSNKQ